MNKITRSLLSLALILLLLIGNGLLCACVDYEYTYYFSVEGGNGTISMFMYDEIFESESSPIRDIGGRKGNGPFTFIATPAEGYRVKQWTCDGRIVQGNKTVIYMSDVLTTSKTKVHITVEFEPIVANQGESYEK